MRGEQQQALRELHAEVLHTSSTHAGFEYAVRPWGTRDFEGNLAPHGWFTADYRNLLRDMMVREEGRDLHLFSALSPEWIGGGKSIRVCRAPTYFGAIDLSLDMPSDSTAVLHLRSSFRQPPGKIVHLPWFMQVESMTANGLKLPLSGSAVIIPPNTNELRIEWKRSPKLTTMSYERTVKSYNAEYKKRYQHFVNTGELSSGEDPWRVLKINHASKASTIGHRLPFDQFSRRTTLAETPDHGLHRQPLQRPDHVELVVHDAAMRRPLLHALPKMAPTCPHTPFAQRRVEKHSVAFGRTRPESLFCVARNYAGSPLSRLLTTVTNFCFLPRKISSTPSAVAPACAALHRAEDPARRYLRQVSPSIACLLDPSGHRNRTDMTAFANQGYDGPMSRCYYCSFSSGASGRG